MRNLQCIPNVFALSLTMLTPCRSHRFFTNIFAKKKKFAKLFSPVHIGPRSNLLTKNKLVNNLNAQDQAGWVKPAIITFFMGIFCKFTPKTPLFYSLHRVCIFQKLSVFPKGLLNKRMVNLSGLPQKSGWFKL